MRQVVAGMGAALAGFGTVLLWRGHAQGFAPVISGSVVMLAVLLENTSDTAAMPAPPGACERMAKDGAVVSARVNPATGERRSPRE